ncbi:MAG: CocE/NonD family hydrolase [Desulfuromonadales bacterium]|nr:CocE/NonD family hydrolase [Desulfuromonadales bacterium]NIR34163.1 CocE/NonD family hydrolase [Desulfuromonadales bacterium]NIS40301.1 CocE/NonD family hydrolase [Desulfuromonadales bacterium]
MSDGVQLAARLWMPENAEAEPVPTIFEYIPYRKRDFKRARDSGMHGYFAGHGYACIRVDIRGSGDSEGVLTDEYLERELLDGEEIMQWIADQPWSDGKVGMIGISWGGFNGLQLAARQPPQLKTIITLCSTDDRYADDVHYMGGCLLGDNLSWSAVMFAYNSLPPDPQIVGEKWKEMWFERLEGSGLWLDTWLRHQKRENYWKHGSICEDFSAVKCPVFAASGWADGYSNAVFRLMDKLDVPRKGLIGPWSHLYPHMGKPGPAIGFLQECLRWWDKWLKDKETGIMDEPMLRVWMLDSVPPTTYYPTRPGRWVAESSWPSPHIEQREYTLGWRLIAPGFGEHPEVEETIQSPLTVGLFAGKWCSYSATPDLPHDQRQEDGGALVFESEPLAEQMEILGAPEVELEFSSDQPVAMAAVRLSDVATDDKATRVTYGLQNLTHQHDHEHPEALDPTKRYRMKVKLNDIAHVFPAGHRFRISISTSYWPLAWAPPKPVRLTIYTGMSKLIMPVRQPREESDRALPPFGPPEEGPSPKKTQLTESHHNWYVTRDLEKDVSTLKVVKDEGCYRLEDIDLEMEDCTTEWYTSRDDEFTSLRGEVLAVRSLKRGDWSVRTVTRTILTCTTEVFHIHADLDAYLNGQRVFCKTWNRVVPRDHL